MNLPLVPKQRNWFCAYSILKSFDIVLKCLVFSAAFKDHAAKIGLTHKILPRILRTQKWKFANFFSEE